MTVNTIHLPLLKRLYRETHNGTQITADLIHLLLQENNVIKARTAILSSEYKDDRGLISLKIPNIVIKPRDPHQQDHEISVQAHDISFGIGPAGTSKSYLTVACTVQEQLKAAHYEKQQPDKIQSHSHER